jgi:ribosomal protein S18 acetylase RimI-like enzyme
MKRVCKKLLEAMERVGIINENTLKELLDNWLPRWKPSANLLREIGNYFEQQQSVHKANGKESASQIRVEVSEEPITALEEHASIPIAFEVDSVLDVQESGNSPREFLLTERRLEVPYIKDYDAIAGGQPQQWARRFDVSNWGLLAARVGGLHVGGAVIAFNTPGLTMLEGRHDLAVLWDIRVSPEARGRGIGSALFRAAEVWARERGCRGFKVETQNINVRACRFYERQGCTLRAIDRSAYPELPDEIQMLWYKLLSDGTPSG